MCVCVCFECVCEWQRRKGKDSHAMCKVSASRQADNDDNDGLQKDVACAMIEGLSVSGPLPLPPSRPLSCHQWAQEHLAWSMALSKQRSWALAAACDFSGNSKAQLWRVALESVEIWSCRSCFYLCKTLIKISALLCKLSLLSLFNYFNWVSCTFSLIFVLFIEFIVLFMFNFPFFYEFLFNLLVV